MATLPKPATLVLHMNEWIRCLNVEIKVRLYDELH